MLANALFSADLVSKEAAENALESYVEVRGPLGKMPVAAYQTYRRSLRAGLCGLNACACCADDDVQDCVGIKLLLLLLPLLLPLLLLLLLLHRR
jgi:hypothetical protein